MTQRKHTKIYTMGAAILIYLIPTTTTQKRRLLKAQKRRLLEAQNH